MYSWMPLRQSMTVHGGRLGYQGAPSYIQLLLLEVTGIELPPAFADTLAVATSAGVLLLGVVLFARDRRAARAREPFCLSLVSCPLGAVCRMTQ